MRKIADMRFSDPKQFARLFHEYYPKLCYYAALIISDDAAAEDIVQDVFMGLMQSDAVYASAAHANNALYLSVRNRCIDYCRNLRNGGHRSLESVVTVADDDEIDRTMIRAEILSMISRSIDKLPRSQREVFRMAYVDGMSNQEIADTLGLSIHTVKVDKQRAKAKLREWLGDAYPVLFLLLHFC